MWGGLIGLYVIGAAAVGIFSMSFQEEQCVEMSYSIAVREAAFWPFALPVAATMALHPGWDIGGKDGQCSSLGRRP